MPGYPSCRIEYFICMINLKIQWPVIELVYYFAATNIAIRLSK